MFKKHSAFFVILVLFALVVSPVYAQMPQISTGLNYLTSSQNPDGTWATNSAEIETTAATVSVIETLKLLNQTSGTPYTTGISWLQAQAPLSVDYIAQRIHTLGLTDVSLLIPSADLIKGGWGGDAGYETNYLDTASALQALKSANYTDLTTINPALAYLTGSQNTDGGWGFSSGNPSTGSGQADSNVYMTAVVSATLQQFPQMTCIATAVNKATSYLLSQKNENGSFGAAPTVYETALAYSALVAVSTDNAALASAVNYIITSQSANGSWNDDPYSTALALKALYLSENKPSPPPPPPAGGKITGTVIDKVTGQKVAGVAVTLDSNNLINTTTDSFGNFTLNDIPAGAQKVNFSLTGYAATTASTAVVIDATANLGNVPMTSAATTGTIAGTITDSIGKPLTGVAITVVGAWSGSATTGSDGTYSFSYVTPGTVTISATKAGYQTVTANGTVYARTTLTFSPRMSTTASQATTGTLVGRVIDNVWGLPIDHLPGERGMYVMLSGGISAAPNPDNRGTFAIEGLQPNTYQVIVGMDGFASQAFQIVISPGVTTDLGTIRLVGDFSMTLTGKVTDATTGATIPGAEVIISGKNLTGRADFAGTYAIADIPTPGEYTLKASATGYVGKSFTIGSSPWTQTMDISLSPPVAKVSLTGKVVDAATKQPLAGVTLTLTSDQSIRATTNGSGTFTFNAVQPGPQQVSLDLSGYSPRTLTMAITVGALTDVGTIPLSTTPLPASIQGAVWDGVANAAFAGVEIQTSGTGSYQTVTAADGTYTIDNVEPGAVTVATGTVSKPGYNGARFTGTLEPGGVLVFNPVLSTVLPPTVDITVQTDKSVYRAGDTVGIAINLQNKEAEAIVTTLHLRVTDPSGANTYETSVNVNLAADGTADQPLNFVLPTSAQSGKYTVLVDAFSDNGMMLNRAAKNFGVAVSQIAVTPTLPAVFSTGTNTILFNLINSGTVPVSAGVIGVTLKDPDGQVVSTTSLPFSLDLGQSKTLTQTVAIPALKFGAYTLSYVENDETKSGAITDILLPNNVAITGIFDDASHRIRETANLTVTLRNTGRFNLDTGSTSQVIALMAEVPDAAYAETKVLSLVPVVGSAAGSAMLYQFAIPETMTPGQHGTRITVTLPSGSTTKQTAQLAIMESSLSLSPVQTIFTAGETIHPLIANSGGVDTSVQYRLSLYDAKAALIAENTNTGTVVAGSTLSLGIAIPIGAVDGSYNLVVNYTDMKSGKAGVGSNALTINGVKGSIQVQTDKQNYLLTESISGLSNMDSTGTPLTGGNLHLQVTTGPGTQKMKTWTTQADFQTGVRNGVDTFGVNDWIIPNDDYNGTTVDSNRWTTVNNVSIQSGKLILDTTQPSQLNSSFAKSNWKLDGDFDIQIDFSENKNFDTVTSFAVSSGSFWYTIGNSISSGYYSGIGINGVEDWKVKDAYAQSGQFRITRILDTIAVYYKSGGSWVELNRATNVVFTVPVSTKMQVFKGPGYPGATATFDNFKVNSGRIMTENQTVDSVRLLPLNDNFDDGVLNADRWSSSGVQGYLPAEINGALRLTLPADMDAGTYASNRSELTGDLDARVDYKVISPWKLPDNHAVSIDVITPYYYMEIIHWRSPWYSGPAYGSNSTNSFPKWTFVGNAPIQGKLRLNRVGSTYSSNYWNGIGWTNLLSDVGRPDGATVVRLGARVAPKSEPFVVLHDNFTIFTQTYSALGTIKLKHDSGRSGVWGKLNFTADIPIGTSIKFRTRTAETEAGLATATWSGYLTASGSAITSPAARWIEVESTLATSATNVTPLLHDVSVTFENNPGEILWQSDVPATLPQGALSELSHTIGTLGMTGKFYLEGTLTSSTGQTVASAEYPFYVEQGNIQMSLAPDKKIYRPGETVTISGEVKNLSSIAATGLTARVQGTGVATPYAETFDLPANSAHPFSFTTMAGNGDIYQLTGSVTQNSAPLADIAEQYEVATPALTATLSAPDTAENAPFTVSVLLTNTGKVDAITTVQVVDDGGTVIGDQAVTLAAGESRILQYTRQITGATTYTAVMSGDLNQILTKKVAYAVAATDSSVGGKVVADKISYNPNEQVTLTATVTAASMRENLSTLVTVTNSQGQALFSATAVIPALIQGQIVTNRNYWNSATYPAGTYLVTLQILDPAGSVIGKATCNLAINGTLNPAALLKGKISLDKQSILTGEPVTVSYSVTNTGNVDLANTPLSIRTVNMSDQTVYDTITGQATLAMGASSTSSGLIDTRNYTAKDYLVVLRATIGGVEETLAGTYFRIEGAPSAPALTAPATGVDVDTFTPRLSVGNAADPNDDKLGYEFEIYSDSGLTSLVASGTVPETTGTTSWTVPAPLTENRSYSWRARAYDGRLYGPWMTPAAFRVNTVNDPPTAPTVSSPAEGTSVSSLTPTLMISNASDPDSANLTYNFDLALDPDFTQIVASIKGVAGGQGTTSWMVPPNLQENGWYYWRAQADDWQMTGPWSATARFLVNTTNDAPTAPSVAAPVNGAMVAALATDVLVTNSIDPDSTSLLYFFEADTVPTFDSPGTIRSGGIAEGQGTTLWHLGGLQDNTRYYLRVKASDGSADSPWSALIWFFANTANDSPTTPTLANPSNGAGVSLFTPTLSVHNATDPDKDILTYEFEIYADASLTTLISRSDAVAETATVSGWTVPVELAENQTCYWRARAGDGSLYSGWMPTASFMVNSANDAPGTPQLSAPAEGSTLATLTPTLEVVNAVDPDSAGLIYDFEVYDNNLLTASVSGVPGGASGKTSATLKNALADNMSYSWRARAFDGDRYGQWMNMATFKTHVAVTNIRAEIRFEPVTLNKKSAGNWVMVQVELPPGYRAADVDISSLRLEGTVPAEVSPISINRRGNADVLTVKFLRSAVIAQLPSGDSVPVHLTGKVGASLFDGVDVIRVIK